MMPMVEQTTENPMVPVADATHIAHLGRADSGDVLATAWLRLDPQNNTLDWTIEYEGAGEITTASLLCPAPDANMPEPEGNGVGVGTERKFTEITDRAAPMAAIVIGRAQRLDLSDSQAILR